MTAEAPRVRSGRRPPAIRERELRSFYADLATDRGAVRVCRGTSCELAGAAALHQRLAAERPCRPAYCLGYCDRSPALLFPDGSVASGAEAREATWGKETVPVPEIRCTASCAVVTERIGRGDFSSLDRAREAGVFRALERAVARDPRELLDVLERSGETGRGGAAFPTAVKWRRCAEVRAPEKVVIANGDEGDPGSYIDRVLLERDPFAVIEGLALCAFAVGARRGIVYVRSEYPRARRRVVAAVDEARAAGLLGRGVFAADFSFDVDVVEGLGSYVCGEETALLNSIEGRRGEVRLRPPYPVESGLWGRPTVVNNVETLVNVPWIAREGADAYRLLGAGPGDASARGTKALCLNAGFARPGIVEVEFGTPLRRVIEQEGGGGHAGRPIDAVVLGGPMGSVLGFEEWDVPVDPAALAARDVRLGHGGIVALARGTDYRALLHHWLTFMVEESCGKCVPCRVGSQRALELADGIARTGSDGEARARLLRLLDVIEAGSLCGFGQGLPAPIRSLLALCESG